MLRSFFRTRVSGIFKLFSFGYKEIHLAKLRQNKPNKNKMWRQWKEVKSTNQEDDTEKCSLPTNNIRLISYNILAQDLLTEHAEIYAENETQYLRWSHRLSCLVEEFAALLPDIYCLQEVQSTHLREFMKRLRNRGKLEYIYKKKTGSRTDGCLIIYDADVVELVEECSVEYFTPGIPHLNRDNVAIMAKFKTIRKNSEPPKLFVVANTHLLYNPNRHDVRNAQIDKLYKALRTFSKSDNGDIHLPVILAGDFNSEPYTPPYQTLLSRHASVLSCDSDNKDLSKNDWLEMNVVNFGKSTVSTHNYSQQRWMTVDYILHSVGENRKQVKVTRIYQLPTEQMCQRIGMIPNKYQGSDHYSLAVDFTLL